MSKEALKAILRVEQVSNFEYGQVVGLRQANMQPRKDEEEDSEHNKVLKQVNSVEMKMQIEKDAPQFGQFNPGDEFVVTFDKVEKE